MENTQITDEGDFIATLIQPDGYAKQVNQVATVWSNQIRFIRRKELALQPFTVELIPMSAVRGVRYRQELAIAPLVLGFLCLVVVAAVFTSPIPGGTRVPVGALTLAAFGGYTWIRGVKRHRIDFELPDRVVSWRSGAGDLKVVEASVQRVCDFARSRDLLDKRGRG